MNFKLLSNTRSARVRSAFIILLLLLSLYTIFNFIHRKTVHRENTLQKYIIFKRLSPKTKIKSAFLLKKTLENFNTMYHVLNSNKYTPILEETPIIVIQVNKDIIRLQYLITSLAQVQNINTVLLIFSHSFFDVNLNKLIKSIDFCKVMQIFYPHSLQLNPMRFPGMDPDDCKSSLHNPRTIRHCLVRDARLTEYKQHWWWKINFVFEYIPAVHTNESPIVFLEEDNYVFSDILYMLQYAQRSFQYFPQVEVISFGKPSVTNLDTDLCMLEPWRPLYHVGIALNRTTWKKILSVATGYCFYNDNSWSYSLFNLFRQFPRGFASMIKFEVPRVISTRQFKTISDIQKISQRLSNYLFPSKVKAVFLVGPGGRVESPPKPPPRGNGGWSDLRDQLLCLDPLTHTTNEEARYYDMYDTSSELQPTNKNVSKH